MTEKSIVKLDTAGETIGDGIPSSEWHMHLAILNAYPEIGAVIHTHADNCVALSCLNKPLPAFHYMVASFGGNDVPCAPYATFGTQALADGAASSLRRRTACFLANHGMIAVGHDLDAAYKRTVKLETLARQYILACSAGTPAILPDDEMERVVERYLHYGHSRLPSI